MPDLREGEKKNPTIDAEVNPELHFHTKFLNLIKKITISCLYWHQIKWSIHNARIHATVLLQNRSHLISSPRRRVVFPPLLSINQPPAWWFGWFWLPSAFHHLFRAKVSITSRIKPIFFLFFFYHNVTMTNQPVFFPDFYLSHSTISSICGRVLVESCSSLQPSCWKSL